MNPIQKRIARSNGVQQTHGRCIICGGRFQECPHSMGEVNEVIRVNAALTILLGSNK